MPADTWTEFKADQLARDRRSGGVRWRADDHSPHYDYRIIRRRLTELVEVRTSQDPARLLDYFNEGVHGNMGGMGSAQLYPTQFFGTKQVINDYTREVAAALEDIVAFDEDTLSLHDKLGVLRRASLCFGRSALMLSGAGALGPFHLGVVKALSEQDILPNVISGASAGAIAAAMAGTCRKSDLVRVFEPDRQSTANELMADAQGLPAHPRRGAVEHLRQLIEASIPDLTFIEAFEESGRHINISVAPAGIQQRSRLLNAITSPTALVRDAVLASCAIPGILPAVTLMARDAAGVRKPYVPSRRWIDGSVTDDMPARRLARLYAANHFISSQANPLVLWALPRGRGNVWSRSAAIWQSAGREWLRAFYPVAMRSVKDLYPLNMMTRLYFGMLTQEYTADINISPQRRYHPGMLLAALSPTQTAALVREGERATWPKVEMIRTCTRVSRRIDALMACQEGAAITGGTLTHPDEADATGATSGSRATPPAQARRALQI